MAFLHFQILMRLNLMWFLQSGKQAGFTELLAAVQ
jgi:hypothetical protein